MFDKIIFIEIYRYSATYHESFRILTPKFLKFSYKKQPSFHICHKKHSTLQLVLITNKRTTNGNSTEIFMLKIKSVLFYSSVNPQTAIRRNNYAFNYKPILFCTHQSL